MKSVSESLAGRAAIVPFLGLSMSEWKASAVDASADHKTFLWKGSFPALWAERDRLPNRDR